MRKVDKLKKRKEMKEHIIKEFNPSPEDLESMVTICPTYHVSYYLANALVYLASYKRQEENQRAFQRSLDYLDKLSKNALRGSIKVWDKADAETVGREFKRLADITQFEYESPDIVLASWALSAIKGFIRDASAFCAKPDDEDSISCTNENENLKDKGIKN